MYSRTAATRPSRATPIGEDCLIAELALEQAHLPAQRRLGDVQALGARVKLRSVATATK